MESATPEQVRAALDAGHVRLMVLYCDRCEIAIERDVIGVDSRQRLATIRRVGSEEGWSITDRSDLCPECAR